MLFWWLSVRDSEESLHASDYLTGEIELDKLHEKPSASWLGKVSPEQYCECNLLRWITILVGESGLRFVCSQTNW